MTYNNKYLPIKLLDRILNLDKRPSKRIPFIRYLSVTDTKEILYNMSVENEKRNSIQLIKLMEVLNYEIDWHFISKYKKPTVEFIRAFANKLDWSYVVKYNKLSEDTILEFIDYIDLKDLFYYQDLSDEFWIKITQHYN